MAQPTTMPSGGIEASAGPFYAALDLGTNNCRLLIASIDNKSGSLVPDIVVHDSFSRIVRLGEGVSASGILSAEAMERTLAALRICQKKLSRFALENYRFVATDACRRAVNSVEFLAMISETVGLKIEIIDTEEEARLAFLGCSSLLLHDYRQALVFDIGGGSTELLWTQRRENGSHDISRWLSVEYGVMNLADKFGGSSFIERVYDDMVAHMIYRLSPLTGDGQLQTASSDGVLQFLSTSGTVTTLAAIHLGLPRYERSRIDGLTLNISDIREVVGKLLAMRPSERFNHPCIGPERADFIISGCAIFEAISNFCPQGRITIADRGVREGIILSLARTKL